MASVNGDPEDEEAATSSSFASRFRLPQMRGGRSGAGGDRNTKFKNKALSVWNNLRNGWVIPTHLTVFGHDDPIWVLGVYYHGRNSGPRRRARTVATGREVGSESTAPHIQDFLADFQSRFWMTYRRGFPEIGGSELTTDTGWGCMLRSGQMILAQALICFLLGRAWRIHSQLPEQEDTERQIMRWFSDVPQECSPFSLHSLVDLSKPRGRAAGQWYGPALVSYLLRDAVDRAGSREDCLRGFKVYVAQDCTVYKQDVYDIMAQCRPDSGAQHDCAVLVLVPVRLGGETLNSVYFPCLRGLLTLDHCVGVIGGRPKHSLFFIGWQGEELVYLDPHCCQEVVDTTEPNFSTNSFHCTAPRKLSLSRMDPSCTIGFFVRDRRDFELCCSSVDEMLTPPMQQGSYPFFTFSSGNSADCCRAAEEMDQTDIGATAAAAVGSSRSAAHHPSGENAFRVMSTFTLKPRKTTATVSCGDSYVHIEPVLCPPPDHIVDEFVVLDVPDTAVDVLEKEKVNFGGDSNLEHMTAAAAATAAGGGDCGGGGCGGGDVGLGDGIDFIEVDGVAPTSQESASESAATPIAAAVAGLESEETATLSSRPADIDGSCAAGTPDSRQSNGLDSRPVDQLDSAQAGERDSRHTHAFVPESGPTELTVKQEDGLDTRPDDGLDLRPVDGVDSGRPTSVQGSGDADEPHSASAVPELDSALETVKLMSSGPAVEKLSPKIAVTVEPNFKSEVDELESEHGGEVGSADANAV